MVFGGNLSTGMISTENCLWLGIFERQSAFFDHILSCRDLDLWPQNQLSLFCAQWHLSCKFCKIAAIKIFLSNFSIWSRRYREPKNGITRQLPGNRRQKHKKQLHLKFLPILLFTAVIPNILFKIFGDMNVRHTVTISNISHSIIPTRHLNNNQYHFISEVTW